MTSFSRKQLVGCAVLAVGVTLVSAAFAADDFPIDPVKRLARVPAMTIVAFDDHPPDLPHVTPYDERHLKTYLRLLDADEEGADWREVVQIDRGTNSR